MTVTAGSSLLTKAAGLVLVGTDREGDVQSMRDDHSARHSAFSHDARCRVLVVGRSTVLCNHS
jgi:hypothetical protein